MTFFDEIVKVYVIFKKVLKDKGRIEKEEKKMAKRLGIIGGLGPMATAYFMELIIKMTDAKTDQQHLEMIIYNIPSIPDRTNFILGKSEENPCPSLIAIGKKLEREQTDYIAIPCITAHFFYSDLEKNISVPIIHIIRETIAEIKEKKIKKVGIMATNGTIEAALFQQELGDNQIEYCFPDKKNQEYVMDLIYQNIKAGQPIEYNKFESVTENLKAQGAEIILLGCTELSLIKKEKNIGKEFLDMLEVLAKRVVLLCQEL